MLPMAEGTFYNERRALEQAFNTLWDGETPIQWENVPFTPPTGADAEYAQFFVVRGDRRQATIGDNALFRGVGIVQVNLWVRAGTGNGRLETLADLVKAVFQRRSISGVIECYETSVYQAFSEDEEWHGLTVQTNYIVEEDYARPAAVSNLTDAAVIEFVSGGAIEFVSGGDIEFVEAA